MPRSRHRSSLHSIAGRQSFAQVSAFLDAHNSVRALHNAPALKWSPSLAKKAKKWADKCQFKHSDGNLSDQIYGENVAAGTGIFPISAAVATFVDDQSKYDPAHPSFLRFTQVVWKSTSELGCAVSKCNGIFDKSLGPATFYVCLYDPAGNVIGKAPDNVEV